MKRKLRKRSAKRAPARVVTKTVRRKPKQRPAARMLRAPKALSPFIPVLAPIRHERPAPPPAPRPAPAPVVAKPEPPAVRVGRLPPRVVEPIVKLVAPPAPARPPVTQDTWKHADEAAARLGIDSLRPEQRQVIRALLEGRDALVALPSGSGKTACYLVAALLSPQPALVSSGRARLLRAHYDRLLQRRIPVAWLGGSVRERAQALERIAAGGPLVVFALTEALAHEDVVSALSRRALAFVALDDAHAASEWSDELRPAVTLFGDLLLRLGSPPTVALLGAATAAARHDVARALGLRAPVVVEGPAIRENVALDVIECRGEVRQRRLAELVLGLRRPGIVYCNTAREVDSVHAALSALRVPAHRYHALLPAGERLGQQLNFVLPGRRAVMVATSGFTPCAPLAGVGEAELIDRAADGFGLGLDKPDLRFVVHYGAPASLEQYAREVGMVGRDGASATAVMLASPEDRARHEALFAELRIAPAHVMSLARALEPVAVDRRAVTLESLALSASLSRRACEAAAAALADAGLASLSGGWLRVGVSLPELFEKTRRVAAWLETLRKQDVHRLDRVASYVASPGCRSALLARYFDAAPGKRAGACACGVCSPRIGSAAAGSALGVEPPRRRPPVQEFSVTPAATAAARRAFVDGAANGGTLTAKLGDHVERWRFAQGDRTRS